MSKLRWIDFAIYLFIGVIIAFIMISSFNWVNVNEIKLFSTTSPIIFPFIVGCALLVFLFFTILKDTMNLKKTEAQSKEVSKELRHDVIVAMAYSSGILVYTVVVKITGFIAGTIMFLVVAMILMNYEEPKLIKKISKAAVVSAITVPLLYFVFYKIFNVMLP